MTMPLILGWEEWVALPGLSLPALRAKIDTGAKTSALHAVAVERFGRSELPFVRFTVQPVPDRDDLAVVCDAPLVDDLQMRGLLFKHVPYEHSYPHCWRCDTPLLNYATSSWFVSVTKIKEKMLELAKDIHWSPEHIKEGRFGKWLEGGDLPRGVSKCGSTIPEIFVGYEDLREKYGAPIAMALKTFASSPNPPPLNQCQSP